METLGDEEETVDENLNLSEAANSTSCSDIGIAEIRASAVSKGKRKAGEKIGWSEDDERNNAYEDFRNRKKVARKKTAATKKRLKASAKRIVTNSGPAANYGTSSNDRVLDEDSQPEQLEDSQPDYLQERRRDFDRACKTMREAGLRLPPRYEGVEFSDDERVADLQERPDFPKSLESSQPYKDIHLPHSLGVIPASIARYLRQYQVEGVAFLHELFVYQKGGILGDDMGLGKTVQVAAFLAVAFGKTGDERDFKRMRKMRRAISKPWYPRALIICPGSLMENWRQELARWGWWHVDIYHGNEREDVLQAAVSGRLEIVITTYNTYRLNKEHLNLISWDCVIADECHIIKERRSETTKALNDINALCRIGLTGTAIQNKYEELWTLLNWTNPGRFGPLSTWTTTISEPLRIGQSHDATLYQLKNARRTAKKLVENLLPQFFIRRMKSLIAYQLPKKLDRVVFCPLTEMQKEAYERFLETDMVDLVRNSTEPCECDSGKKSGWCCYSHLPSTGTKWQALVFPIIVTLQKIANHLALLLPRSKDAQEKQERELEFLQTMLPDHLEELYANRDSIKNLSNPEFCGKWKILKKLLKFWHENGDKVLIFSHSVQLLRMLEFLFNNTSYNVSFLSGSMRNEDRQKTVDDFNSDPNQFVFLISTKAGGIGLNITSANKVVIFDPNWNPSYDLQAQDRAYRIGQLRDVEVYRLVSAGTIEEIVYARQIYKQQQANIGYNASTERRYFKGVQHSKEHKGEIFGLSNLLTFQADSLVLRNIVNKTNVAEARYGVDMVDVDMDSAVNDDENPLKVDNDDNGDGAMSQLAKLIADGEDISAKPVESTKARPKTDAIQAILASAGVEYTHENSEVIGSSRVEAQLSRRAEELGNDVDTAEQRLFVASQGTHEADESGAYVFNPPEDVKLKQFCTMAKMFGFESATEFALAVEGMTQRERTDVLERFYRRRKERLTELAAEERKKGMESAMSMVTAKGRRDDAETLSSGSDERVYPRSGNVEGINLDHGSIAVGADTEVDDSHEL